MDRVTQIHPVEISGELKILIQESYELETICFQG
jgi:hypothetical protein